MKCTFYKQDWGNVVFLCNAKNFEKIKQEHPEVGVLE